MKGGVVGVLLFLSACTLPGDAAPVVKLGVIAPFEGSGRALGYAVLPVIKSAILEANASDQFGRYGLVLVALDDSLDPASAARQAEALAVDSEVIAVIGPFTEETAASAAPVLRGAAIPFLPVITAVPKDEDYTQEVTAAREAADALLQALAADIAADGQPSRAGLSTELAFP